MLHNHIIQYKDLTFKNIGFAFTIMRIIPSFLTLQIQIFYFNGYSL